MPPQRTVLKQPPALDRIAVAVATHRPADMVDQAAEWRETLLETLSDVDDEIAEIFLGDGNFTVPQLKAAIRRATIADKINPVLTGSAFKNKGVQPMLDAVVDYLPSPLDVDHIDGLSPAISIEQKTTSKNPRSTVGTVTEIYDYLRLLFARVGVPYSPATGLPIESQTVSQMVDRVLALPEGTRIYLLAPFVRGRKGEYRKELADLARRGFQRVKIDGTFHEIDKVPALNKKVKHDIDIVVDRIAVRKDIGNRLPDSLETALKLADGIAIAGHEGRAEPGLRGAEAELECEGGVGIDGAGAEVGVGIRGGEAEGVAFLAVVDEFDAGPIR